MEMPRLLEADRVGLLRQVGNLLQPRRFHRRVHLPVHQQAGGLELPPTVGQPKPALARERGLDRLRVALGRITTRTGSTSGLRPSSQSARSCGEAERNRPLTMFSSSGTPTAINRSTTCGRRCAAAIATSRPAMPDQRYATYISSKTLPAGHALLRDAVAAAFFGRILKTWKSSAYARYCTEAACITGIQ